MVLQKEFYERQNTMLAHAAARTGKRGRRRDTFHFDHRSLGPASPESPVYSGVSGEGGSLMHGHMGGIMEAVQEEDDVDGATALTCGDLDGDSGTLVKKARRHGTQLVTTIHTTSPLELPCSCLPVPNQPPPNGMLALPDITAVTCLWGC